MRSALIWLISEKEGHMPVSGWLRLGAASLAIAASTYGAIPARATDVIAEWSTIQIPPPPTLKPVTVDPKSTALFLLDFMTENCGQRPRCVAAVPTLKTLHDRARAANMLVEYTLPGGGKIIERHQDGYPLRHLRPRRWSWHRGGRRPARLLRDLSGRLFAFRKRFP